MYSLANQKTVPASLSKMFRKQAKDKPAGQGTSVCLSPVKEVVAKHVINSISGLSKR